MNTIPAWLLADAPIIGDETGFNERADVIVAADGTDLNEFWNEVQDTIRPVSYTHLAVYQRQR